MQSKMTEKEFRNELRRLYEIAAPEEVVVAMIKRTGLEFAPEPKLRLPERLIAEHRREGLCWSDETGERVLDLSLSLASPDRSRQREIVSAAFEKANAYPGLRAAAEALHGEMVKLWPDPDTYGLRLKACLSVLGAELAKGPKA